jgi:Protein of unknown function (DUF2567)
MTAPVAPRVSRETACVAVVAAMVCGGALAGGLWAWLAPPAHGVVALSKSGERVHAYLGSESDHFFLGAFLLLGLVSVLAVIAAVAAWQWRAHRGPAMVVALMTGAAGAAAAACGLGAWLVHLRYGTIDIDGAPVSPEHRVHYVTEAPAVFFGHGPFQIAMTMLVPAAVAAFVYALLTVAAERDDLGAYPPEKPPLRLGWQDSNLSP